MMDGKMDDRDLKLKSLMDLIQEMKMEGSHDLPGKPKVLAVDIHAQKMPIGEMPEGDEEKMEDPAEEKGESPEFEKGEEEGEMEAEQHPEGEAPQGDLLSQLPPAIQQLLKEHLRKKM